MLFPPAGSGFLRWKNHPEIGVEICRCHANNKNLLFFQLWLRNQERHRKIRNPPSFWGIGSWAQFSDFPQLPNSGLWKKPPVFSRYMFLNARISIGNWHCDSLGVLIKNSVWISIAAALGFHWEFLLGTHREFLFTTDWEFPLGTHWKLPARLLWELVGKFYWELVENSHSAPVRKCSCELI